MAAGKIFAMSFALNAVLGSSFSKTMSQGVSKLQQLQNKTRELSAEESRLNSAWRASQSACQTYQSKMGNLVEAYTSGNMSQQQYSLAVEKAGNAMRSSSMSADQYRSTLSSIQQEAKQTSQHLNALQAVSTAKENFTGAVSGFKSTMGNVGLLASPVLAAVDSFTKFDATLSKVKAIANATDEDMAKLKAQASELGRTTMFSATQAAEAMTYLGMAGWNTEQIMSGMPGMLDLAAASGSNLATVADIVSDDLTAFGMSAEQAGHMADVMAAASTNANTNVEMMGMTFKYAGAIAGSLGYSLEDVAVATGLMANAGIKAEMAGTSLRAIMNRLVAPPKAAADAMQKLDISVTNADGSIKPFMETMEDLRDRFEGLTEAEKAEMASDIAGTEAMSGFLAIVNASEGDFEKLCGAIDNADGAAARFAKTSQDNLQGDLTALKSATEGVANAIGETLTPALRTVTKIAVNFTSATATFIAQHSGMITAFVSIASGASGAVLAIKGFKVASTAIAYARAEMVLLQIETKGARAAILSLATAFKNLTWSGVVGQAGGALARVKAQLTITLTAIRTQLLTTLAVIKSFSLSGAISGAITAFNGLGTAIMGIARAGLVAALSPMGIALMALAAAAYYCYTNWETAGPLLAGLWEPIATALTNAWAMIQPALQGLYDAFAVLSEVVAENSGTFSLLAQIVGGLVVGAFITLATMAVQSIATAISTIATIVAGLITTFTGLIQFITGVFTGDWATAWQGILNIFDGVFGTIGRIAERVLGGIQNTINSITSSIGKLSLGGGGAEISHNANGGIYGRGAFLTTFAENSPEAAIPIDGSRRAAALWEKTGDMMGLTRNDMSVSLSIPVTINGNADSGTVSQIQQSIDSAVERALQRIQHQRGRVSYA